MRIALFHNLPSGGAKRHTYEQVKELTRRGHWVEEFTFTTADMSFIPLADYVRAVHVEPLDWRPLSPARLPGMGPYLHLWQNGWNLRRLESSSRKVADVIDAGRFDVVLAKDCMFTVAPYILRYLATPTVFQAHSMLRLPMSAPVTVKQRVARLMTGPPQYVHRMLVRRAWLRNIQAANAVLTNSQFTRGQLRDDTGVDVTVVYPGVDAEAFCPTNGERERYVLSVGALLPSKGHDLVLASLAQLDERIRPALLIAAASGDSVERVRLESLAQSLGVQMSIVNVRTTKAMADRYARALVVVAAPVYEALGLSPLEAMACGTPVIVAKVGGLVETVKTGETGMIVERSAAALAGALRTLLEDTVLAERMGQQGRAYVLAQWTWQRAVDRLEGHLEHACST